MLIELAAYWNLFYRKTKNIWLGFDFAYGRLKTHYKNKTKEELEEEMFWLEEQLNIPSNLRWHNKNK